MTSTRKKVVIRRFSPGPVWGYLSTFNLLEKGDPPTLGLLDLSGRMQPIALPDVKYVCYVREFNTADAVNPERLLRRNFTTRPRGEGLWVRLQLRDGDQLEGLAALDHAFADGWMEDGGVYLTPPDTRGNTQRMFVPRAAFTALEILAVVTTPSRKKPQETPAVEDRQPDLFTLATLPGTRIN